MNDIISISNEAANQIKKILSKSPDDVKGIIVGVDKTGCSGYAYKINYLFSLTLEFNSNQSIFFR